MSVVTQIINDKARTYTDFKSSLISYSCLELGMFLKTEFFLCKFLQKIINIFALFWYPRIVHEFAFQ